MGYEKYALIQRLLHWLIALMVIGALGGGLMIDWLENGPFKNQVYFLHKSFGVTILALMLCRLLARMMFGAPPLPDTVLPWQRTASHAVHGLFYLLLIAMPLIGWAATSAYPAPVPVFGLFEMPGLVAKDRELSETLFAIHGIMGKAILALAIVHIGAAIMHGMKRDGVFSRMWF